MQKPIVDAPPLRLPLIEWHDSDQPSLCRISKRMAKIEAIPGCGQLATNEGRSSRTPSFPTLWLRNHAAIRASIDSRFGERTHHGSYGASLPAHMASLAHSDWSRAARMCPALWSAFQSFNEASRL